jgi:ABC-type sugar transport system permease subunit
MFFWLYDFPHIGCNGYTIMTRLFWQCHFINHRYNGYIITILTAVGFPTHQMQWLLHRCSVLVVVAFYRCNTFGGCTAIILSLYTRGSV